MGVGSRAFGAAGLGSTRSAARGISSADFVAWSSTAGDTRARLSTTGSEGTTGVLLGERRRRATYARGSVRPSLPSGRTTGLVPPTGRDMGVWARGVCLVSGRTARAPRPVDTGGIGKSNVRAELE